MPRPSQSRERSAELLPIIAETFVELGYRRTTTAELAARCGVRENILYRLWPNKSAMFVATIDYVYEHTAAIWQKLLDQEDTNKTTAERILRYESTHHGEFGLYQIVFTGLTESDDPDIREALQRMYGQFHSFIRQQITAHRRGKDGRSKTSADLTAWAIVGLGTVANISRELELVTTKQRGRLFTDIGRLLLEDGHP